MRFTDIMEHVARAFEVVGAGVLVVGLVWSIVAATRTWRAIDGRSGYRTLREAFGGRFY
jgi:hypothetical protein